MSSAPPQDAEDQRKSGFVVLCDIAAFSQKKSSAQRRCVKELDSIVGSSTLISKVMADDVESYVLNCIGDGFVLIATHRCVGNHPDLLLFFVREVLEGIYAWNLTDEARKDPELQFEVRVGIHVGKFYMGLQAFGRKNAIGPGVNVAARVANAGDPGHVLISREAVEEIAETTGGVQWLVESSQLQSPISIGRDELLKSAPVWHLVVKHGEQVSVHPWTIDGKTRRLGSSVRPKKLDIHVDVERRLREELCALCDVIEEAIGATLPGVGSKRLALRATVLYANFRKQELVCTNIRDWRPKGQGNAHAAYPESPITYPFDRKNGKLWGMPAHILDAALGPKPAEPEGQVQLHFNLPEWPDADGQRAESKRQAYAEELKSRWGIPPEEVMKLTRKARAYMGAAIAGLDDKPFGVLMIDSKHPMFDGHDKSPKAKRLKEKLAGHILRCAERTLPPLLHIRYSPP